MMDGMSIKLLPSDNTCAFTFKNSEFDVQLPDGTMMPMKSTEVFSPAILTFQEFIMSEPVSLAAIQQAVLEFLRERNDAVLFGAQAVNAYVTEPRMTQDIDLLSDQAQKLAQSLKTYLHDRFHIAVRIRKVAQRRGYRLYHIRKEGNRHLVDIQQVKTLPHSQKIAGIHVMAPADLIASKVISYQRRQGQPKSGTDWRDIAMLLLRFPELKSYTGSVQDCLEAENVEPIILKHWRDFVEQDIQAENDEFGE